MHTFLNIAVIIIVAAVVATLGDRVGRVAAKRHVAFLGLRPRLAAAWIAVFTGMLIALATLGLVTLISRDAREMLFHFDEIKARETQLKGEVETLEFNRKSLVEDNQKLEKSLSEVSQVLADKEQEAEALVTQIEEGNARRAALEREMAAVERKLKTSQADLASSQQRLNDLRAELQRLDEQVGTLRETKNGMEKEARQLEERLEEQKQRLDALRSGNIEIEVNQPLRYVSLPAKMTLPDSQRTLITALDGLRKQLEARGLTLKPVPAASVGQIMNSVSLATDDVIVVVLSANNVLAGDTVEVDFELALDRVVFRQGEIITRANIEADVTRDELPQFFANALAAVRAAALSRGMLPDITTGDIGVISAGDIAGVADEIEQIQGKRVLEIHAGKDFRTTDVLDSFQFTVKPAKG
jgi:uncharacterized protein (DUF3084 family)